MNELDAMKKTLRYAGYEVLTRREVMELQAEIVDLRHQTQSAFVDGVFWALEGYPTDDTIADWQAEAKRRWPKRHGPNNDVQPTAV